MTAEVTAKAIILSNQPVDFRTGRDRDPRQRAQRREGALLLLPIFVLAEELEDASDLRVVAERPGEVRGPPGRVTNDHCVDVAAAPAPHPRRHRHLDIAFGRCAARRQRGRVRVLQDVSEPRGPRGTVARRRARRLRLLRGPARRLKRDRRRRRRFGGRRGALLEDWRRAGRGVVVVVVVARPFFFGPLLFFLGCWLLMFELRLVEVVVHSGRPLT